MGRGIALHMASSGVSVSIYDNSSSQLESAADELGDAVTYCDSLEGLRFSDFVIEAVFEDLNLKRQVLREIESVVSEDCVLATNTSSLLVSDIAAGLEQPARFLGVHYNNPANGNPVVEVIAHPSTAANLADDVTTWYRGTGKLALQCADTHGFILNRQSLPYINQAARCLTMGTPGQIDTVARQELGVGLGPFAVMNLVGTRVMAAASLNLATLGQGYQAAHQLQQQPEGQDWDIRESETVDAGIAENIRDLLLGAMMFPARDILTHQLCAEQDLHQICLQALGYATSSTDLLKQLPANQVEQLINGYLSQF